MFFKKFFKSDKRKDERIHLNGIQIYLDKRPYNLADLSHTGFAVDGNIHPNAADQIYHVDFKFTLSNREMMVSCRAKHVWHRSGHAGFEFFQPTRKEVMDIDYFIKSHQHKVAAE